MTAHDVMYHQKEPPTPQNPQHGPTPSNDHRRKSSTGRWYQELQASSQHWYRSQDVKCMTLVPDISLGSLDPSSAHLLLPDVKYRLVIDRLKSDINYDERFPC